MRGAATGDFSGLREASRREGCVISLEKDAPSADPGSLAPCWIPSLFADCMDMPLPGGCTIGLVSEEDGEEVRNPSRPAPVPGRGDMSHLLCSFLLGEGFARCEDLWPLNVSAV
tara:strand:- start:822 stop:1163 length:342 start_codon:yes stop_codon:yes gene_type:complete